MSASKKMNRRSIGNTFLLLVVILVSLFLHLSSRADESHEKATLSWGNEPRNCSIRFNSEPELASIRLDGTDIGTSPNALAAPCGKPMRYTISMEGYEPIEGMVTAGETTKPIYARLKKIPMGQVSVILPQNADVYVEKKMVTKALANKAVSIPVQANKKLAFEFVNPLLGVSMQRDFWVGDGKRHRERIYFWSKNESTLQPVRNVSNSAPLRKAR